ncbi:hypothetical protein D3C81_1392870 [compost metagenome]
MIQRQVEVFQRENLPHALCHFCQPGQRIGRLQPHCARHHRHRFHRQPLRVQAGTVQIQARAIQALRHRQRLFGALQQLSDLHIVGQIAAEIAGHRSQARSGSHQSIKVLIGPVPDFDAETQRINTRYTFCKRQVEKHHFGANGQLKTRHYCSPNLIGLPCCTDAIQASAISRALRASCPVARGFCPC